MITIYLTTTPYGTKRIWFFKLANVVDKGDARSQAFDFIEQLMGRVSCWRGGADKIQHDDQGRRKELSWELPKDAADSIYAVVKVLLNNAQIEFDEDHDF